MENHRKPVRRLEKMCLFTIVNNFEKFMAPYYERWEELVPKERPTFGPFGSLVSPVLILIIEELIKWEKLTYQHLSVLLPEHAKSMRCDENTLFSPFDRFTIKLISERCPDFKVLHCHEFITSNHYIDNSYLEEYIPRLKFLQEINFCDAGIPNGIIRCIAINCHHLRELNLHNTNADDNDVYWLLGEESVIKENLNKFIIDSTLVTGVSVEQYLIRLPNLTYFRSDNTIEAALRLFERLGHSADTSDAVQKFKTSFCKSMLFKVEENHLTEDFVNWLYEKFPDVKHLSIMSIEPYQAFYNRLITSWNHITQLELSAGTTQYSITLQLPAIVSCQNLITLNIENFKNVDIAIFGSALKKLEKLTLVNNSYQFIRSNEILFENLKDLKIFLFPENIEDLPSADMHTPYELLLSILASENIEKILFYNQSSFTSQLVNNLLERDCLRNLKELKVFRCHLGIDCIRELLNRTAITDIVVGLCHNISEEDINQISTYCKENNLATSITLALKRPYYFRWLVQHTVVPLETEIPCSIV